MPATMQGPVRVIDYDADDYDYCQFWDGREYEDWAEARVIRRLLRRAPIIDWMADLGCGFGRNVPHYRRHATHLVLIDYSWKNLRHAEATLLPHGPNDRLFLVRGNLYHLPFRDNAFDVSSTVRVIHHLAAIDAALAEMGRTIRQHWMLDVPIKHHLLARARAALHGAGDTLRDRDPHAIGTVDEPFYNFHLAAIRQSLQAQGWTSHLVASVANFRRWETLVPRPAQETLRPLIYGLEAVTQATGRGWWGPSQFLWLTRSGAPAAPPLFPPVAPDLIPPWDTLASRMCCPFCKGYLIWTMNEAICAPCDKIYRRKGAIWDFASD